MIETLNDAKQFDKDNNNQTFYFEVFGEDTSGGGPYDKPHRPHLGYYEGNAVNVYLYAETLPSWKSWGRGGILKRYISPIIETIDESKLKENLDKLERLREIEKEAKDIKKTLGLD